MEKVWQIKFTARGELLGAEMFFQNLIILRNFKKEGIKTLDEAIKRAEGNIIKFINRVNVKELEEISKQKSGKFSNEIERYKGIKKIIKRWNIK